MEEWITVKEAAEILNISQRHIRNKIQAGQLKAKRDGRLWLVHSSLSSEIGKAKRIPKGSQKEIEKLEEMVSILKKQIEEKDRQIENFQNQLMDKDKQIAEKDRVVEEARQRSDTIIMQLTRQLGDAQKALEHHKSPWWRRLRLGKGKEEGKA